MMPRRVAALVFLQIIAMRLTLPVDVLVGSNLSASLDAGHIAIAPWSILIEEQLGRARFPHLVEHLLEMVGAVEEEHQYCNIYFSGLFCHLFLIFRRKDNKNIREACNNLNIFANFAHKLR